MWNIIFKVVGSVIALFHLNVLHSYLWLIFSLRKDFHLNAKKLGGNGIWKYNIHHGQLVAKPL